MAFRKSNDYNPEKNSNGPAPVRNTPGYPRTDPLSVSNASFNKSSLTVSAGFTGIFLLMFWMKKTWSVYDADAQTITMFAGSLSALMIAIPLFLKDLQRGSTFWKQFYVIAFIMVITASLGVYCFLDINDKPEPASVEIYFILSLAVSVNTNTIAILARSRRQTRLAAAVNPELTLLFSLFALLPGIFFASGHYALHAFLMLTFFGLYLMTVLMTAVLFQLVSTTLHPPPASPTREDFDHRIKRAIQSAVEQHPGQALNEQQLIDRLRKEHFPHQQEIISATSIQQSVTEMDSETDPREPMVKISEEDHNLVIPRWRESYDAILENANPRYLAVSWDEFSRYTRTLDALQPSWEKLKEDKNFINNCYSALSIACGLSAPLLADNASLEKKYRIIALTRTQFEYQPVTYILLADEQNLRNIEELLPAPARGEYTIEQLESLRENAAPGEFYQDK